MAAELVRSAKPRRRRVMGVVLATILWFVPACGDQAPPDVTPQVEPSTSSSSSQPPSSAIELRLYGIGADNDSYAGALLKLTEGFSRQYPNIVVKLYQFNNYPDKAMPDLVKAGKPPDLILFPENVTPYFVETGLVLNLREFMTADQQFSLADISESALQLGKVGGRPDLYVMPFAIDNVAVFYNKNMFKQAAVPEPGEDWTWDDLISVCKRIQQAQPGVTCLHSGTAWLYWYWYPWVLGYGGDVLSADGSKSTFSSPETTEALRRYVELWTKHRIAQSPNESSIDCFGTQKCAVTFGTASSVKYWQEQYPFDWGVQMMPKFPSGRFTVATANGFGIAKEAQHPKEAWQLLKYLLSVEVQRQVVSSGWGLPVLKAAPAGPSSFDVFVKGQAFAAAWPDYPNVCGNLYFGDLQSIAQSAIEGAIKGYQKLEEGLKRNVTKN